MQINVVNPVGSRRDKIVFSQSRIQIGGKWNQHRGRVEKPYLGVMAGLVFNKIRPLDMVKEREPGSEMMGHVRLLDTIPYNYRDKHLEMFERMQQTQTSDSPGLSDDIIVRVGHKCGASHQNSGGQRYVSAECFRYSGDGTEIISPVYTAPTLPPFKVIQSFPE